MTVLIGDCLEILRTLSDNSVGSVVGTQSPGTFQSAGTKKAAQNNHPTVKPIALMRYLIRLVTPPGSVVLDPFMGSGTTGCAALADAYEFIGIEIDPDYAEIAQKRIRATQPGLAFT